MMKMQTIIPNGLCQCGCGRTTQQLSNGEYLRYCNGHGWKKDDTYIKEHYTSRKFKKRVNNLRKQRQEYFKEQGLKLCCRCKIAKPFSEFNKNNTTEDKLNYYCKTCLNKDSKQKRIKKLKEKHILQLNLKRHQLKKCNSCKNLKHFYEFNKCKTTKDGLETICKDCTHRKAYKERLKYMYNLTPEQYQTMLEAQNYKCAISSLRF